MRLIATKPLTYEAKVLKIGDEFEAPELHARIFKEHGQARDADEAVKEPEQKTKRRYRRRDMRAED